MTARIGFRSIVFVRDQDEALRFYLDGLGLEKGEEGEYSGGTPWVDVAPASGHPVLTLVEVESGGHLEELVGGNTGIVFITDGIQESYDSLKDRGVRFDWEPVSSPWGGYNAQFADPDNNAFLLIEEGYEEHFKKPYVEPEF